MLFHQYHFVSTRYFIDTFLVLSSISNRITNSTCYQKIITEHCNLLFVSTLHVFNLTTFALCAVSVLPRWSSVQFQTESLIYCYLQMLLTEQCNLLLIQHCMLFHQYQLVTEQCNLLFDSTPHAVPSIPLCFYALFH